MKDKRIVLAGLLLCFSGFLHASDFPISTDEYLKSQAAIDKYCSDTYPMIGKWLRCQKDKNKDLQSKGEARGFQNYMLKHYTPAETEQLVLWLDALKIEEKSDTEIKLPQYMYDAEIIWITKELHKRKAFPGATYQNGKIYLPVRPR